MPRDHGGDRMDMGLGWRFLEKRSLKKYCEMSQLPFSSTKSKRWKRVSWVSSARKTVKDCTRKILQLLKSCVRENSCHLCGTFESDSNIKSGGYLKRPQSSGGASTRVVTNFLLKTHMVDTVTCCSIGLKEAIDIDFFKSYLEAW